MPAQFDTIALIGKPNHIATNQTLRCLYDFLTAYGRNVLVESRVAEQLSVPVAQALDLQHLGKVADLAIVVGGDGNMLGAARVLARYNVPVLGVNRGNLGFLTDLSPQDFEAPLRAVLDGHYQTESRFLLNASVSTGFSPAAGSSRQRISGPVHIARAISSRRCWPYDISPARRLAQSTRSTTSSQ